MKKKAHSAPESDSSSSIYDATPVPKKKLSLDEGLMKQSGEEVKEFNKEKCQRLHEKELDEASTCSSVGRSRMVSPAATLTSVSCN